MNEVLSNLLNYALPSGLFVQLLNWMLSFRKRKARDMGEIDTLYIDNINKLREELIKTQDENRKLYRAISRLERAVSKATACRHFAGCPMRGELQEQTTGNAAGNDFRPVRQPARDKKGGRMARDDPRQPGEPEDTDGQCG